MFLYILHNYVYLCTRIIINYGFILLMVLKFSVTMKYIHGKVLQLQFEKGWGGLPNYLDKIEKPENKQQIK